MASSISISFDPGKLTKGGVLSCQIWESVLNLLEGLLRRAELSGQFKLKAIRQSRWQGNPEVPFKISRYEHGKVYLTVKPPGHGNDSVFDYSLMTADYDERQLFCILRDCVQEDLAALAVRQQAKAQAEMASNGQHPPAEQPKLSIAERITLLEKTAGRNREREQLLAVVRQQQAQLNLQLAEIQQAISEAEDRELALLTAMDDDHECLEAQQALQALETLLSR